MIIKDLPRLQPVSTTDPHCGAALLVDEAASSEALFREADRRLTAAQQMLFTATLASEASGLEGVDMGNIAQAAQLLASDALDLMRAMHSSHLRAAAQQQASRTIHHFGHGQGE